MAKKQHHLSAQYFKNIGLTVKHLDETRGKGENRQLHFIEMYLRELESQISSNEQSSH